MLLMMQTNMLCSQQSCLRKSAISTENALFEATHMTPGALVRGLVRYLVTMEVHKNPWGAM